MLPDGEPPMLERHAVELIEPFHRETSHLTSEFVFSSLARHLTSRALQCNPLESCLEGIIAHFLAGIP